MANSSVDYPIWLQDGYCLTYDQDKLKAFLVTRYQHSDVTVKQVIEELADFINRKTQEARSMSFYQCNPEICHKYTVLQILHHYIRQKRNDMIEVILRCTGKEHCLKLVRVGLHIEDSADCEPAKMPRCQNALHAAIKCHNNQVVTLILMLTKEEDRLSLFKNESPRLDRNTIIQHACQYGYKDIVEVIFDALNGDQWVEMISEESGDDLRTALQVAIEFGQTEIVQFIKNSLDEHQWHEQLTIETGLGDTALYVATEAVMLEIIKLILDSTSNELWYELLQFAEETQGSTPLHKIVRWNHIDTLNMVKKPLTDELWFYLLKLEDLHHRATPLHYAAACGFSDTVQFIQNSVTEDQWHHLLMIDCGNVRTPLHAAAGTGVIKIIQLIKDSITLDRWYELLEVNDEYGYTAVHTAALHSHEAVIHMLKRTITDHELQINLFAPLPPKQPLTLAHDWPYMYYGYSDPDEHGRADKLIEMHRIDAKIEKAIHSCSKTGM